MGRPIIGIAANEINDAGKTLYHLPISYTPAGYVRAVQEAGGVPFVLPVGLPVLAKEYIQRIDKLILAGGQNVSPELYNESVVVREAELFEERDQFELALIEEALSQDKPIFAVCRGMQLLNVALGGSLFQELDHVTPKEVAHMQTPVPKEVPTHKIQTEAGSMLRQIYGKETSVNSFHYQAVKTVGKDLKITALSEDGIIEGVERKGTGSTLLGVQWHPDFAYTELEQEMNAFSYVVEKL